MPSLSLVAEPLNAFIAALLLEDCSSVTKNNSTDEYRVNASLTLQVLWKWLGHLCISENHPT
jgi:hypothetical protein